MTLKQLTERVAGWSVYIITILYVVTVINMLVQLGIRELGGVPVLKTALFTLIRK